MIVSYLKWNLLKIKTKVLLKTAVLYDDYSEQFWVYFAENIGQLYISISQI